MSAGVSRARSLNTRGVGFIGSGSRGGVLDGPFGGLEWTHGARGALMDPMEVQIMHRSIGSLYMALWPSKRDLGMLQGVH